MALLSFIYINIRKGDNMNVQLGKYKGLGFKRPNIVVKDEEIDSHN